MKIGIICALDTELAPFLEALEGVRTRTVARTAFTEGTLYGCDAVLAYCGVAKVNAALVAQILASAFQVTHMIMPGVAGGMVRELHIGDTVISTELCQHDLSETMYTTYHPYLSSHWIAADHSLIELFHQAQQLEDFPQRIAYGRIVSGDEFIEDDGREAIQQKCAPLCVDMESAAVAYVCCLNDIPFIAVRSISDSETERGLGTFEANCARAAQNSFLVTMAALRLLAQQRDSL